MADAHLLLRIGMLAGDCGTTLRRLQLSSPPLASLMRTETVFREIFARFGRLEWDYQLQRRNVSARAIAWMIENRRAAYGEEQARAALASGGGAPLEILRLLTEKIDHSRFDVMQHVIKTNKPRVFDLFADLTVREVDECIEECALNGNLYAAQHILARAAAPDIWGVVRPIFTHVTQLALRRAAIRGDSAMIAFFWETVSGCKFYNHDIYQYMWGNALIDAVINCRTEVVQFLAPRCAKGCAMVDSINIAKRFGFTQLQSILEWHAARA